MTREKCVNIPTNITPCLRLFLQESDNTRGLEFFMPQEYVWSDPGWLNMENHSPIVEIDVLAVRGG